MARSLFDRAEVMLALQGDTNSLVRGTLRGGDMTMSFATPIRPRGEVIGCVLASAPVLRVTPALLGFIQRLGFTAAGIFILSILVSGAIAQRLSAPARKLEEATRKLAAGDLSARVAMHRRLLGRGDEMDALTREFNRMAERLETTDEERRAFLADISHELRTPLCAIKGSAENLARRRLARRESRAAFRFDHRDAKRPPDSSGRRFVETGAPRSDENRRRKARETEGAFRRASTRKPRRGRDAAAF